MTKLNNKGVALIAAVVTALIFFMLVVTVTVISVATYKKSGQGHDRAMALSLAQAGINDALYRMNYQRYGANPYPSTGDFLDPDTTLVDAWTANTDLNNPFGLPAGSGYQVKFSANGTNPNDDQLVSTGKYNGKARKVSILIRGNNSGNLNNSENGIAEGFNKHAIYADTVSGVGASITGNIARVNIANISSASANYSVTTVPSALFLLPTPNAPSIPGSFSVYFKGPPGHSNEVWGFGTDATGKDTLFGPGANGVVYNSTTQEYTFTDTQIAYSFYVRGEQSSESGSATFAHGGGTANSLSQNVKTDNGISITGDITLNKAIVSNSITLSGGTITINDSASTDSAAIIAYAAGSASITISVSPTITLGANQNAAIMCYSTGGTATVTVDADLRPTYDDTNGAQAAIIAYSEGNFAVNIDVGSAASIDENSTSGTPERGRSIYSYRTTGTGGGITLNTSGTVYGTLVTNQTVTLTKGTLIYNSPTAPSIYITSSNNGDLYKGFSSGRRVYLPVPGSWKEE